MSERARWYRRKFHNDRQIRLQERCPPGNEESLRRESAIHRLPTIRFHWHAPGPPSDHPMPWLDIAWRSIAIAPDRRCYFLLGFPRFQAKDQSAEHSTTIG